MSLEDEIAGWQRDHPVEFGILCNAFGDAWIQQAIAECIGASSMTKLHPLGRKMFFSSNGNLAEVLLLAKFFSIFGADGKSVFSLNN